VPDQRCMAWTRPRQYSRGIRFVPARSHADVCDDIFPGRRRSQRTRRVGGGNSHAAARLHRPRWLVRALPWLRPRELRHRCQPSGRWGQRCDSGRIRESAISDRWQSRVSRSSTDRGQLSSTANNYLRRAPGPAGPVAAAERGIRLRPRAFWWKAGAARCGLFSIGAVAAKTTKSPHGRQAAGWCGWSPSASASCSR